MDGAFRSIIVFCVAFLLFIALREVWCWYWKINAAVASLDHIADLLKEQIDLTRRFASSRIVVGAEGRAERSCPWCARSILADARVCRECARDVEPLVLRHD